jgi:hypothetical protein
MRREPAPDCAKEDRQAAGTSAWEKATHLDQGWIQCGDLRFAQHKKKLAERSEGICDGGHTRKKKCGGESALIGTTPAGVGGQQFLRGCFRNQPGRSLKQ